MLAQRMEGRNRAVPLLVGLAAIPVLLVGDPIVGLVPQPVVAGMLGFIAISFVLDWAWDLRRRVNAVELTTTLAIAASIPAFGFLLGIGLGLALTLVWFVIQYGRLSGVRRIGDAVTQRSNVNRSRAEDRVLNECGGQVVIAELTGYLFFGTGDSVLRRVQARSGMDDVRWLIIDLSRVSGADSSAVVSFGQVLRWAERNDIEVLWCHLSLRVSRSLSPLFADGRAGEVFADLDRALESTEIGRLADARVDELTEDVQPTLLELIPELRSAARTVTYERGDAIRRFGERGPGLTIIETGSVSVEGGAPGTRRRRLGAGAVLGEVALYRDDVATATVIAEEPCTAIEIDRAGTDDLAEQYPAAASRLHQYLARIVADRLVAADRTIDGYRAAESDPVD